MRGSKMGNLGGKAATINRAAAEQPKMKRQAPAGGNATPMAKKPQKAEMGSGGFKAGIDELKANHKMQKKGAGGKYR